MLLAKQAEELTQQAIANSDQRQHVLNQEVLALVEAGVTKNAHAGHRRFVYTPRDSDHYATHEVINKLRAAGYRVETGFNTGSMNVEWGPDNSPLTRD